MSAKTVIGLAFVAAAIVAPEVIPSLIGVVAGSLAAVAVTAAVEVGLALTESVLLGPANPNVNASLNNQVGRLHATLDTTAPRKTVFGHTAMATDIRYDTYTGSNQDHYHQVIACAAHAVESIDEIWLDNEKAWDSSDGVLGRYVGYLTVDTRTEGTSGNGIAIDGTWTASCTLTGCAYIHLDFLLVGPDSSTPSPFQAGVTNRITIRGKGAKIYDPRLDSTVAGGSGSMRADDQTTWAWDDNASRNPALQELFYELGWKINGVLSVGKGIPPSRLALADYITAANICDESVALKAGGSEPRYRSDGVISEGDDSKSVRDALCTTMNAELRDNGSGMSLQIFTNDLADIACDFGADDIIVEGSWDETQTLDQYHNVVRGRCVDPSDTALYQLTDYPEWSIDSPDGIDRIDAFDLPMVQSPTQAQRLAKLRGMRSQFQGKYGPTLGPRAWRTGIGRNVTFTHPVLPWTGKVLRTVGQTVTRNGATPVSLLEEDPSIYDWDPATDEKDSITAGTPTVYDPANNPLLPGVSQVTSLILTSSVDSLTFSIDSSGNVNISDHTRVYSDKSVAVEGLSSDPAVTATRSGAVAAGGAAGDLIYVFYDDAPRAGGAVTYQFLRLAGGVGDASSAQASSANPYRHLVCAGFIPGSGSTTSGGSGAGSGGGASGGGGSGLINPAQP